MLLTGNSILIDLLFFPVARSLFQTKKGPVHRFISIDVWQKLITQGLLRKLSRALTLSGTFQIFLNRRPFLLKKMIKGIVGFYQKNPLNLLLVPPWASLCRKDWTLSLVADWLLLFPNGWRWESAHWLIIRRTDGRIVSDAPYIFIIGDSIDNSVGARYQGNFPVQIGKVSQQLRCIRPSTESVV
jgi:hypothetical protein